MVVDRNQRCYTNCVRWLRHKGILLEFSPRMVDGLHNNESHHGKHPVTANATLPTYDRSALIPVSFILVLARFIALIRLCMPIYWPASGSTGVPQVNLIGGEQQIADLQQDLLYTVAEMSDTWTARVVGW